jgi:hypothetical protein
MRIVMLVLFLCGVASCLARAQDVADRSLEQIPPRSWVFSAIGKLNAAGYSITFPLDENGRIVGIGITRFDVAFALLDTYRGRFDSGRQAKKPSKDVAAIRDRLFKEFGAELQWADVHYRVNRGKSGEKPGSHAANDNSSGSPSTDGQYSILARRGISVDSGRVVLGMDGPSWFRLTLPPKPDSLIPTSTLFPPPGRPRRCAICDP